MAILRLLSIVIFCFLEFKLQGTRSSLQNFLPCDPRFATNRPILLKRVAEFAPDLWWQLKDP